MRSQRAAEYVKGLGLFDDLRACRGQKVKDFPVTGTSRSQLLAWHVPGCKRVEDTLSTCPGKTKTWTRLTFRGYIKKPSEGPLPRGANSEINAQSRARHWKSKLGPEKSLNHSINGGFGEKKKEKIALFHTLFHRLSPSCAKIAPFPQGSYGPMWS